MRKKISFTVLVLSAFFWGEVLPQELESGRWCQCRNGITYKVSDIRIPDPCSKMPELYPEVNCKSPSGISNAVYKSTAGDQVGQPQVAVPPVQIRPGAGFCEVTAELGKFDTSVAKPLIFDPYRRLDEGVYGVYPQEIAAHQLGLIGYQATQYTQFADISPMTTLPFNTQQVLQLIVQDCQGRQVMPATGIGALQNASIDAEVSVGKDAGSYGNGTRLTPRFVLASGIAAADERIKESSYDTVAPGIAIYDTSRRLEEDRRFREGEIFTGRDHRTAYDWIAGLGLGLAVSDIHNLTIRKQAQIALTVSWVDALTREIIWSQSGIGSSNDVIYQSKGFLGWHDRQWGTVNGWGLAVNMGISATGYRPPLTPEQQTRQSVAETKAEIRLTEQETKDLKKLEKLEKELRKKREERDKQRKKMEGEKEQ